ncbi:DUF5050 domain-containing protein [uncultured Psychroserpens sp.]|uniref:TolB family protein n=1 Tax=uncultured Psychroserpens sp. TaxID=255436 RepID=UPI0026323147|nr:DUF5050 domain-containing protein [uncultured Psychroserpens sp.]
MRSKAPMKNNKILYLLLILLSISVGELFSQNYEVLFTKQINGTDQLFVTNSKGDLKQITTHRSKDSSPVISPDGNYIVFASERLGWWKIWLMDLRTKVFTQLTNSSNAEYAPSWSPDGKHIVFISTRDGNSEIYTIDKNGNNLNRLTNNTVTDTTPYWGKNEYIYYSSNVSGIYQIVRMLPDGSKREVLTSSDGNKLMPQISNDANKILYYGDEHGNLEIYILYILENETKRITNHKLMDIRPRWSSDNKKIVFERGNKDNNQHIYIMNIDGSNIKKVTKKDYNYAPSFVPNGIRLITE